jgi:hypothetical protein
MALKKIHILTTTLIIGLMDWVTTVIGLTFFGASEANPLLSGLSLSNILLFSFVKLFAVTITGLALYKAASISLASSDGWRFSKGVVKGGYALTSLILSFVVANNFLVMLNS